MIRLSVIIPGYNTPVAYWQRAIRSVLERGGLDDVEIICVDDGSSVKPKVEKVDGEERVKWLYLGKNEGQAQARNRALEIARGKYVTFVDSDDEVVGDIYRDCVDALERTGADVCLYGVKDIWPSERLMKYDVPAKCEVCVPTGAQVEAWYTGCVLNYVSNKVIRRSYLDVNGIRFSPDGMPCEDVMLYLETLIQGAKWCAIDKVGYIYYKYATTSLAHYKSCHHKGTMACAETWARFCATRTDGEKICGYHAHISPQEMAQSDWENIWRGESPYSLIGKYKWLKSHSSEMGGTPIVVFFKQLVKSFIRQHLYFTPVRRRHYMSIYSNIERMNYSDLQISTSTQSTPTPLAYT